WEVLAKNNAFLAGDATLRFAPFRRLGSPVPPQPLDDYRLAIAFMTSSPRGTSKLDFEAEETAILNAAGATYNLNLFVEDSGDPEQLGQRLAEFRDRPPVLHISCHGAIEPPAHPEAAPKPFLCLEDRQGQLQPTSAPDLINAIKPYTPRLLFLSGC